MISETEKSALCSKVGAKRKKKKIGCFSKGWPGEVSYAVVV
jgi:hypothetical protein